MLRQHADEYFRSLFYDISQIAWEGVISKCTKNDKKRNYTEKYAMNVFVFYEMC